MFSVNEQIEYTNQSIVVVLNLPSNVVRYTYKIYDNDYLINYYDVLGSTSKTVNLTDTGNYTIVIEAYDKYDTKKEYKSGIYNIDKEAPVLKICESCFEKTNDIMDGVVATDNVDGVLTSKITTNYDSLNMNKVGTKKLIYTVYDSAGNYSTKAMNIEVIDNNTSSIVFYESLIILVLFIIISGIIRYRSSLKLEKRFGKYSIKKIKDNSYSLSEKTLNFYKRIIKYFSNAAKKSAFLTTYSNFYEKYVNSSCSMFDRKIDVVSSKFLISIVFLLIAVVAKTLQFKTMQMYEMVIPTLVGFFLPDIIYKIKYKIYRKKIENDLLQGIIIMNNSFKSGRSITQAIDLVAHELTGPISEQFKKVSVELASGLGIDVAFKRFADRINIEEVTYLTASLTILNSTGGNIIKVFSSIEHSLFSKKKLRLELSTLTSSSKIIIKVLFAVPLLFILFVLAVSPTYFEPFFNTKFGIIIVAGMIIYYIIYIYAVSKIMKVRM